MLTVWITVFVCEVVLVLVVVGELFALLLAGVTALSAHLRSDRW